MIYPKVIENVIASLMRLPGVGRRSAERMVFWLLNAQGGEAQQLSREIVELKERLTFCRVCNNFAEGELCSVCQDAQRDAGVVCIVENPKDVLAIEKTGLFKGCYHVLLGNLAPSEGRGPDDLNLEKLLLRLRGSDVREVILATDADMEGELTALHLTRVLQSEGIKISRIGVGIPAGGSVEFADISTLAMSLRSRRELSVGDPLAQGQV